MARFRESQPAPEKTAGYHPTATADPQAVAREPYAHELPRWLHTSGIEPKRVETPLECEQAFREGWTLRPE